MRSQQSQKEEALANNIDETSCQLIDFVTTTIFFLRRRIHSATIA